MIGNLKSSKSPAAKKGITENKLPSGKCDVKHSYQSHRTMKDKWAGKLGVGLTCVLNGIDTGHSAAVWLSERLHTKDLRDFLTRTRFIMSVHGILTHTSAPWVHYISFRDFLTPAIFPRSLWFLWNFLMSVSYTIFLNSFSSVSALQKLPWFALARNFLTRSLILLTLIIMSVHYILRPMSAPWVHYERFRDFLSLLIFSRALIPWTHFITVVQPILAHISAPLVHYEAFRDFILHIWHRKCRVYMGYSEYFRHFLIHGTRPHHFPLKDNDDDHHHHHNHVDGMTIRLWTAAINGPIVHPPGDIWGRRTMVEWYRQQKLPIRPPELSGILLEQLSSSKVGGTGEGNEFCLTKYLFHSCRVL
jgi:hypothetical protein